MVGANLGWHNRSDRNAAIIVPTKVGTYRADLHPALVGANLGWHNRSDRDAADIVPTKVGTHR
ncbi:hypothetical protein C1922_19180 [Stenotrophomonas sp. ZAC14D2_NAIMI4_7]|nr:hypothetical protein C1922_19180 [Stenotrophomonas sp. ZAC14D2_NAIMI4_7]